MEITFDTDRISTIIYTLERFIERRLGEIVGIELRDPLCIPELKKILDLYTNGDIYVECQDNIINHLSDVDFNISVHKSMLKRILAQYIRWKQFPRANINVNGLFTIDELDNLPDKIRGELVLNINATNDYAKILDNLYKIYKLTIDCYGPKFNIDRPLHGIKEVVVGKLDEGVDLELLFTKFPDLESINIPAELAQNYPRSCLASKVVIRTGGIDIQAVLDNPNCKNLKLAYKSYGDLAYGSNWDNHNLLWFESYRFMSYNPALYNKIQQGCVQNRELGTRLIKGRS